MKITKWEQDFFTNHRTVPAVMKVEFVNERMSSVLSGRCITSRFMCACTK